MGHHRVRSKEYEHECFDLGGGEREKRRTGEGKGKFIWMRSKSTWVRGGEGDWWGGGWKRSLSRSRRRSLRNGSRRRQRREWGSGWGGRRWRGERGGRRERTSPCFWTLRNETKGEVGGINNFKGYFGQYNKNKKLVGGIITIVFGNNSSPNRPLLPLIINFSLKKI